MVPLEVEAQIKLLWRHSGELLDFIWGRATTDSRDSSTGNYNEGASTSGCEADSWSIFFTRVVLVTPNKFRPASKIGEALTEHPQNLHLLKVMECDVRMKLINNCVDE